MTAPTLSLDYFTNDVDALIAKIEDRGIHPSEAGTIVGVLRALSAEIDDLYAENKELSDYRANSEAEELADLRAELAQAQDRIATLEIRLHDARRGGAR